MAKKEKEVFELRSFRPPLETLLYSAIFILPSVLLGLIWLPLAALGIFISVIPAGLLAMWMDRGRTTLTMGADGFSFQRFLRERFVPWKEFVGFEATPRGIVTDTASGRLPLGRARVVLDEMFKSAGKQRFRERSQLDTLGELYSAAKEWREERDKPRVTELLEPHAEKDWPGVFERAAQGDFRTSAITQTHLMEDLLHPDTPPALRELLADTLQVRVEESEVREAVEVFASERSKKALRSLLDEPK